MRSLLVLIAVCACYPPSPNLNRDGGTDGGSTAEMCTFSGAKSGAVKCTFTSATWDQASNRTLIQLDSEMGAPTTVSAQFSVLGTPSVNTMYSGGTADTECTVDVTEGAQHWGASTGMSIGGCVLQVRTVRETSSTATTRTYDLHGGYSASVQADDPDGGTVIVLLSF